MFGHGKYCNANHIPTIHGFPALALVGVTALSPTERNPSSRNDRRRRSSGNGEEGEAPPYLKSHVTNPTESTVHRSEALASIYGELQVTSRYRSGTLGGLGPAVQKNLTERQFLILSTPASVFGHGKYGNTNCIPTIRGFPALALVGMTALSPTERNPSSRNDHRRRSPGNVQEGEAPP